MWNDAALTGLFTNLLGVPVEIAISDRPLAPDQFTGRELNAASLFEAPQRRAAWLNGRSALKRLLWAHGESGDTAGLQFPNCRFSISHGVSLAVAVRSGVPVEGIGIDLEFARPPMSEEFRRLFLSPAEWQWLRHAGRASARESELRLWTIKEAVFKADPGNKAAWLSDYLLEDLAVTCGRAFGGPSATRAFRYASLRLGRAQLSVAILEGRTTHA